MLVLVCTNSVCSQTHLSYRIPNNKHGIITLGKNPPTLKDFKLNGNVKTLNYLDKDTGPPKSMFSDDYVYTLNFNEQGYLKSRTFSHWRRTNFTKDEFYYYNENSLLDSVVACSLNDTLSYYFNSGGLVSKINSFGTILNYTYKRIKDTLFVQEIIDTVRNDIKLAYDSLDRVVYEKYKGQEIFIRYDSNAVTMDFKSDRKLYESNFYKDNKLMFTTEYNYKRGLAYDSESYIINYDEAGEWISRTNIKSNKSTKQSLKQFQSPQKFDVHSSKINDVKSDAKFKYQFDEYGNWTRKEGPLKIYGGVLITRKIEYY